ncbi:Cytochrome protein, partial [Ophiophagus hannah]
MRKLGLGNKAMESQIQEEAQQLVEFFAETKGMSSSPTPCSRRRPYTRGIKLNFIVCCINILVALKGLVACKTMITHNSQVGVVGWVCHGRRDVVGRLGRDGTSRTS